MIFKNWVVYPIKIFSLAISIFYVESIVDAEARNSLYNRHDSDSFSRHAGRPGLRVCPAKIPGI
jgi:hypothetical protein